MHWIINTGEQQQLQRYDGDDGDDDGGDADHASDHDPSHCRHCPPPILNGQSPVTGNGTLDPEPSLRKPDGVKVKLRG